MEDFIRDKSSVTCDNRTLIRSSPTSAFSDALPTSYSRKLSEKSRKRSRASLKFKMARQQGHNSNHGGETRFHTGLKPELLQYLLGIEDGVLIRSPSSPSVLLKKDEGSLNDGWAENAGDENWDCRYQSPDFSKMVNLESMPSQNIDWWAQIVSADEGEERTYPQGMDQKKNLPIAIQPFQADVVQCQSRIAFSRLSIQDDPAAARAFTLRNQDMLGEWNEESEDEDEEIIRILGGAAGDPQQS